MFQSAQHAQRDAGHCGFEIGCEMVCLCLRPALECCWCMPSSLLVNLPAALAYHTDKGCCDHACQHSIDSACGISAGYMQISVERAARVSADSSLVLVNVTSIQTVPQLQRTYWWPYMRADVERFVGTCVPCQRNKSSTQAPAGLLQPIPIPGRRWEMVSLDLITGLPTSEEGNDAIAVFVESRRKTERSEGFRRFETVQ